jgi:hypothetical protein
LLHGTTPDQQGPLVEAFGSLLRSAHS